MIDGIRDRAVCHSAWINPVGLRQEMRYQRHVEVANQHTTGIFMSSPETPETLLFVDAVRFFTAVTKDGNCPMCKTNDWSIAIKNDDHSMCFVTRADASKNGVPAYELELVCRKCGFIRMHRTAPIAFWIKANPTLGGGEV